MKVFFLSNLPSPYRVDFFNELGKYCDLTVAFERKNAPWRNAAWKADAVINFKAIYLNALQIRKDKILCMDVLPLLRRSFDYRIVCGYASPTQMLAIEYMHIHKIDFWIEVDGMLPVEEHAVKNKIKTHFISAAHGWFSSGVTVTDRLAYYGAKRENICEYPFTSLQAKNLLEEPVPFSKKKELRNKLGMRESMIVLSVGQFIPRKGYDVLLKAWENASPEWGLYLVGDTAKPEYQKMVETLELKNVHFVGFKAGQMLSDYYLASDLFVLPTREDIWGLVINEAMARGLPIITTERCVAGLELVRNKQCGYIVPVDDVRALAISIQNVLEEKSVRQQMAYNSLKAIRPYTIENMVRLHVKALKS